MTPLHDLGLLAILIVAIAVLCLLGVVLKGRHDHKRDGRQIRLTLTQSNPVIRPSLVPQKQQDAAWDPFAELSFPEDNER